jgi:hypothetical protein
MDIGELDLKILSDGQLIAVVQALHDDGEDEPTELLRLLEREIADRKRRGRLQ